MSEFKPYHEGFPAYVDLLDPYDDLYLVRLGLLADVASRLKVPKEHREGMRSVFEKHANDIKEAIRWPEDAALQVVQACRAVGDALDKQKQEDAEAQQQQ